MIIFRRGMNKARKIAYKASIKDLPIPRVPISIGNFLFHISCSKTAWKGESSMFRICLQAKLKYSGLIITHESLFINSSLSSPITKSIGLNNVLSSTSIPSQASSNCFCISFILVFCLQIHSRQLLPNSCTNLLFPFFFLETT